MAKVAPETVEVDLVTAVKIFDPDFETLNLFQKIARITGMIGGVEKKGYNAFHKYHYTLESDLVTAVRQYLAAAGIVIIPNAQVQDRDGDLTVVDVEYTVTDGTESFTFHMPGYGADRGDKGVYKAITGSQKYALMKLFKIDTGDDPEGDTRVDERVAQSQQRVPPRVTAGERGDLQRGAHSPKASPAQLRKISELSRTLDLSRQDVVAIVDTELNVVITLPAEEDKQSEAIVAALREVESADATKLIEELERLTHNRTIVAEAAGDGYG